MSDELNLRHHAETLHRAARASRNCIAQEGSDRSWAAWVPSYLDQLGDLLDPPNMPIEPPRLPEGNPK